jgi:hypothetical protein
MRDLVLALVLALVLGCHKHHDEPKPGTQAEVAIDWDRCTAALRANPTLPDAQRAQALLDACPVCGDWKPLLDWGTLTEAGGPKRQDITSRLDACHAYCNNAAKQRFTGTIDDARGRNSRAPWRYLGEICKDQVSAAPDTRYMSAPYFALDRIARAAAAHGGDAAAALAKIDLPLPAVSLTGAGLELPEVAAQTSPAPPIHVTMLGDGAHVGKLPRARLGANGVTVDFGGEPYPGPTVALDKVSAAIHALDPSPTPRVALFMAKQAPPEQLRELVLAARDITFEPAGIPATSVQSWPIAVVGPALPPPAPK